MNLALRYRNPKFPAVSINNAALGQNDLYTVPKGRKALVVDAIVSNPTGGAIGYQPFIKIGSMYYAIGNVMSEPSNGWGHNYGFGSNGQQSGPILLNYTEKFSINTDAAGLVIWVNIIEFDDDAPIFRSDIRNWAAGNNTLLTVPTDKSVRIGGRGYSANNNPAQNEMGICYRNGSGSTRTLSSINVVPPGGSVDVTNQFAGNNTIVNGAGFVKFFHGNIAPGTAIVIVVDAATAGQFAWVNYIQVP